MKWRRTRKGLDLTMIERSATTRIRLGEQRAHGGGLCGRGIQLAIAIEYEAGERSVSNNS